MKLQQAHHVHMMCLTLDLAEPERSSKNEPTRHARKLKLSNLTPHSCQAFDDIDLTVDYHFQGQGYSMIML